LRVREDAKEILENEGITKLYPPQQDVVKAGVLDGESIVLCTPTASGKTLAAELTTLKVLESGKQAIYVVPLRALASEKFEEFSKWEKLGYRIELQMGDLDSKFLRDVGDFDIMITTAEKLDSIMRSKPGYFNNPGLLVMDEIHLITTNRGPTYEIILAKFKKLYPGVQILGLSATIGNAEELSEWLDAKLVKSSWRPVKLTQETAVGKEPVMIRELKKAVRNSYQLLIFVNSRRSAESVAEKLGGKITELLPKKDSEKLEELSDEILGVLSSPTAQCKRLAKCVKTGAAFHHAGLVNKQRSLVENAFKKGLIKMISCTPTLAAGINLPARKVIIRDIKRYTGNGMDYIPVLEYMQMVGRAGRPKYDKVGYSLLLSASDSEEEMLKEQYLNGEPENIHSQLSIEPILRMHVLAAIASRFTLSKKALLEFLGTTLFAYEYGIDSQFEAKIERILNQLSDWGFIHYKPNRAESLFVSAADMNGNRDEKLIATRTGVRISELYLDPATAHDFIEVLEKKALDEITAFGLAELFCLSSELRPLMRVKRSEEDKFFQDYLDYEDKIMTNATDSDYLERFKTAMMFNDWMDEKSEEFLLEKYGLAPGLLRIKLNTMDWLAYAASEISHFFDREDRLKLKKALQDVRLRLKHGVKEELLPLITIKGIGRVRARKLYEMGYKTRAKIAHAKHEKLAPVLGKKTAEKVIAEASR